jgi:hypothetical protein
MVRTSFRTSVVARHEDICTQRSSRDIATAAYSFCCKSLRSEHRVRNRGSTIIHRRTVMHLKKASLHHPPISAALLLNVKARLHTGGGLLVLCKYRKLIRIVV